MKTKLLILLLACALAAFGTYRYILSGPRSPLLGFDSNMQQAYDAIKIGDTFTEVRGRLGEPMKSGDHLLLPQQQGFEQEFRKSKDSNSKIYYLWINGSNWYYSIGFEGSDRVAHKAQGNS